MCTFNQGFATFFSDNDLLMIGLIDLLMTSRFVEAADIVLRHHPDIQEFVDFYQIYECRDPSSNKTRKLGNKMFKTLQSDLAKQNCIFSFIL